LNGPRTSHSRPNIGCPPCRRIIGFEQLVDRAKLGWRIERDYQELNQEVGLGLMGEWVARFTPPHNALRRRLWVPDRRKGEFFPSGVRNQGRPAAVVVPVGRRSQDAATTPRAAHSHSIATLRRRLIVALFERLPLVPVLRHGPGGRDAAHSENLKRNLTKSTLDGGRCHRRQQDKASLLALLSLLCCIEDRSYAPEWSVAPKG
jgi:hypothetical protein